MSTAPLSLDRADEHVDSEIRTTAEVGHPLWFAGRLGAVAAPALINLNHPANYVHWHFFQMSVANVVVVVLMIAVFVAALLLPFRRRERQR